MPPCPLLFPDDLQSAQRLRDERDALQARLDQTALETTMGAALAETQKLKVGRHASKRFAAGLGS